MPCLSSGSNFCGVLLFWYSTVVPQCSGYSAGFPRSVVPCSSGVLFRRCSVVPCSGVPGFIVCLFAQVGLKNSNFQSFQQKIFRTTGLQLEFLILIEFPNILHWKPAKKIKLGVVFGQNVGQIKSNVVKKVKKQVISLGFFHILLGITF